MTLRTASADQEVYGELLGLVELGKAKYLGERYDERGVKEILVDTGHARGEARPNAKMQIAREFFTSALREYTDWQEKWWREAIQNAIDGGASEVRCAVKETEAGIEVSCDDNGRGMDERTLLDKFLMLGATSKTTSSGSTGGFGKAKELLVLPWISWHVHTRDMVVYGSGISCPGKGEECETEPAPMRKGTKLTVLMAPDQTTSAAAAIAFIGKCDVPGVKFFVDGEQVKGLFKKGELLREFEDKAALYLNKSRDGFAYLMLIRANGLFMFGLWANTSGLKGTLVVELLKPSIDLLTVNRDGFRDTNLRRTVEQFVGELAADASSALKKKKGLIREKFRGSGKFEVSSRDLEAAILKSEGSTLPDRSTLSLSQIEDVVRVLRDAEEWGRIQRERLGNREEETSRITPELASAMLTDLEMRGPTQVEAAIKQLSWEPDFFLVNEVEGWHVPKKFYPEGMAPRTKQLLRYWAECCRFVLIQLGSAQRFGVGFWFSEDGTGASYISEGSEDWLVINPYGFADPRDGKEMLSLADKDDLAWLYAAAVHECTHIADGISYHNESFASAMTKNVAKTAGRTKQLNAIRKAIVKR